MKTINIKIKNNSIAQKSNKIKGVYTKQFSIIHNYHSPCVLWTSGRYYSYDDNIQEYNHYIQAFLTKRFTHKKEIPPKIKVIKDLNNILKEYHNTFYVQISYPIYNLLDIKYLKFAYIQKTFDSGCIISRFFEEYEKPMYDAMLEKVLVCGRVEFLEDREYFNQNREKINSLIDVFYNGDKLSRFEREIERAYLIIKQRKYYELESRHRADPKLIRKDECFLSFSEKNKLYGHVNFRMMSPDYFFRSAPIFERINVDQMFNSLFEIRYNTLTKYQIYQKLKIKFLYRKSLLNSNHRVEFVSQYIYFRIYQYLQSYEFLNEFELTLNFKINFNMMLFHIWLIIMRLKKLQHLNDNSKFCGFIIDNLIEKLADYYKNNLVQFQLEKFQGFQLKNMSELIKKTFNRYTFHFEVQRKNNNFDNLVILINNSIFDNSIGATDNLFKKFVYYAHIHYEYFNTLTYNDIESNNFDFSVNRIPINYYNFIDANDKSSLVNKISNFPQNDFSKQEIETLTDNFINSKHLFFGVEKVVKEILSSKNLPNIFDKLRMTIGGNPFYDKDNYSKIHKGGRFSLQSIRYRIAKYIRNELNYETAFALYKYNEQLKQEVNRGTIWEENKLKSDNMLGFNQLAGLQLKRSQYLNYISQSTNDKNQPLSS